LRRNNARWLSAGHLRLQQVGSDLRQVAKPLLIGSGLSRSDSHDPRLEMSDGINPRQVDVEEASSRLNEGLESCRSVMRNYRAMLGNQRGMQVASVPVIFTSKRA
jgi:hypothetical protein